MDILLENVPQTLPETRQPLSEFYEYDPFDIITMVYQPGMILAIPAFALDITDFQGVYHLFQACIEVMHGYMASTDASTDDDPALVGIAMARALECVTIEYCTSRNKDDSGTTAAVMQLQNCAQLLKEMLADHQSYINSRIKHDRRRNHSTEKVERAWAALIKNKANLDEFKKGRPDTAYLEARKIFLPQGATLIVEYWQRELNAFVSELETVSRLVSMRGWHRAFYDPTNTFQTSEDPARLEPQKVRTLQFGTHRGKSH
jgi:hypothetical protein